MRYEIKFDWKRMHPFQDCRVIPSINNLLLLPISLQPFHVVFKEPLKIELKMPWMTQMCSILGLSAEGQRQSILSPLQRARVIIARPRDFVQAKGLRWGGQGWAGLGKVILQNNNGVREVGDDKG